MEIETINRKVTYSKNVRSSDSRLLAFDLPSLIESMKQSYTWANGELNALVLLKSQDKQVILTAMHDGTEILSYQSNDSITFQIIEGKLQFHIRKDTVTLNKGQLLTLEEHVRYRLTTDQETVFLLTISTKSTGPAGN
jgi:quercetin dioxygenase-like cupin family protein